VIFFFWGVCDLGSWDSITNHQANLFPTSTSKFSTVEAVDWYISMGVDPSKVVIGMPVYGRSFMNTQGPGSPFQVRVVF
jgi:chitinase